MEMQEMSYTLPTASVELDSDAVKLKGRKKGFRWKRSIRI